MSVGGNVVQLYYDEITQKVWVNTYDSGEYCSVLLGPVAFTRNIKIGDKLWWQGGIAYWSRKAPEGDTTEWSFTDEKLPKIGGSGVRHPLGAEYELKHDYSVTFKIYKQALKDIKDVLDGAILGNDEKIKQITAVIKPLKKI